MLGPEQARLLTEFEAQYSPEVRENYSHHEEGLSAQRTFKQQVLALVETIEDMGNPFLDDTPELLSLDNRHIIDESVADSIRSIEALGKEKFREYEEAVILDRTMSIFDPIENNSPALFKRPKPKPKFKQAKQVAMLKDNISLFSRLYIVAKHKIVTWFLFSNMKISNTPLVNCDLQRNQICYTFLLRKVSKILQAHLMLWPMMVLL